MSFYGRPTEEVEPRPYRRFVYRIYDGGQEHEVAAHQIYFYEHGRVGFWNNTDTEPGVSSLNQSIPSPRNYGEGKRMSMMDDLHRLTRPHAGSIQRDDGKTYHQAESLLNQLREAFGGLSGQGAGGGGTPAPLALNAYDIYRRIEAVATKQYWDTHDGGRRATLEGKIQAWVRVASARPDKAAEAADYITGWVREIEAHFKPPKPLTISGPCPQCGYAHYLVIEEGEHIRKPTLIGHATPDAMWVACEYCQARWEGEQIHTLLLALDTPQKELTKPG